MLSLAEIGPLAGVKQLPSVIRSCIFLTLCNLRALCIVSYCRFDELLLLKRGGRTIFHGALGADSNLLIDYFTQTPGALHDDRQCSRCVPFLNGERQQ